MRFVRRLKYLSKKDVAIAGGKGADLGEMARAGMPVPDGFVILTNAFEAFYKKDKIISEDFTLEVLNQFRSLGVKEVAVRSSATVEDSLQSAWAGQFKTFLYVQESDLLEKIGECWNSFGEERVASYQKKKGITGKIEVAVIIQKIISAKVSGVVFSKDPLNPSSGNTVIEAGFGLGEALVSGNITPDKYIVGKELSIIDKTIGKQERMIVRAKKSGTQWQRVAEDKAKAQKISDEKIQELSELVLKIEKLFGYPIDVEWAVDDKNNIYIIQARPITSPRTDPEVPKGTWSNVNLSEVVPGAVPPLVSDTLIEAVTPAFCRMLGLKENSQIMGTIKGHLYFNLSEIQKIFKKAVGESFAITDVFGGSGKMDKTYDKISLLSKLRFVLFVLKTFTTSIYWKRGFEQRITKIRPLASAFSDCVETTSDPVKLMNLASEITLFLKDIMTATLGGLFGQISYFFLSLSLFKKWLNEKDNRTVNELYASGGRQLQIVHAFCLLWDISRKILEKEALKNEFLMVKDAEQAKSILGKPAINKLWLEFMEEYGHRAVNEINFSLPRWKEDPSFIISTLKNYINAKNEFAPGKKSARLQQIQQHKLKEILAPLPFWKSFILLRILKMGRRGLSTREYAKSEAMHILVPLRTAYLKIGAAFVSRGLMDNRQDIFMLSRKEINKILSERTDMRLEIENRTKKFENYSKLEMPEFFPDHKMNMGSAKDESVDGKLVLKGLAVSHGKVRGIARVIADIKDIYRLQPGDILVTDHTDPGWTPVFITIGGVITNIGGLLSHAAIVAREYGLPAVMNVKNATKAIKDGQIIFLDGNTGIISKPLK